MDLLLPCGYLLTFETWVCPFKVFIGLITFFSLDLMVDKTGVEDFSNGCFLVDLEGEEFVCIYQ